ncbi:MAG: hypothetical protein EBX36_07805, partial [Planctomycetia bacterium]|nr:hypothetical protein [Planctomycetia bacterium]
MTVAETTMDVPQAAGSAAPRAVLLSPEDRRLMSECLQGHREAWDAFVDRFLGLFAFVVDRTAAQRGIMISSADHDDLVADILLEILHHDAAVLRGFEGRSSLATYLAVVARRVTVRGLARLGAKAPGHRVGTTHEPADGDGGQTRLADREQVAALLGQLEETEA